MTLKEWSIKYKINILHEKEFTILNIGGYNAYKFYDLWHLEDYAVSTVSGPIVYMVPKIH